MLQCLFFSIDLGVVPPLGNLLFPGNGLWTVPSEVPTEEHVTHPSLSDEVIVIRDEWGIPHIYASNYSDLTFALGYCHAQDRFFPYETISGSQAITIITALKKIIDHHKPITSS